MIRKRLPQLMGIINVTPDSFSDGGAFNDPLRAAEHGLMLADEGATILDIGGESTRPGAETVPDDEEIARVIPVIRALSEQTSAILSIDTRKPAVARAAFDAGATVWNDVTALDFSADSLKTAASLAAGSPSSRFVLMHMKGQPKTMQNDPYYDDVVSEVCGMLRARIEACEHAGISRGQLIIDPGVGFGKTTNHNLALLNDLESFKKIDAAILVGASRKRFIATLDREGPASDRLGGSIAAALAAAAHGADILRVHDVAATRQALAVFFAINSTR